MSKKIAYLISAYTEPKTLANLIKAINTSFADIFIHIDKKVDAGPFYEMINLSENIYFVPDNLRIKVYWGGYSQVEMQESLIKYMFSFKRDYDMAVSLTGTDYPIVSNKTILKNLCDTEKQYIIGYNISNEEYVNGSKRPSHKDRFVYYYRMDGNRIIRGVIRRLKIKKVRSYEDLNYNFYYGSEYWALSYECLKEIVDIYDHDKNLQSILKTSFAPSESWIHTIFFNSQWKHYGIQYEDWNHRELQYLSPLTYFDYRGRVKVLKADDFETALSSKKMFARKIIVGESDALIAKINKSRNDIINEG